MSFITIIETLLLGPLKLLFEIIFQLANRFVNHPGLSIIFLSLIMNILVLPLYKRADAMQEEARDMDAKLHKGVAHIKKTFSGDEKMMILQVYYRQNNYRPTDALNGSVSLLLEIPFFMAAYQFLSHLELLSGASLGPIADLGAPDGLLTIGGITINLLPVAMTLINVISSAIYLKGFPLKTKIQLYGMALFFLVFLYKSPAGLVFYWTLNNVFSLVKTIFYKIKNSRKVMGLLASAVGILAFGYGMFFYGFDSIKRKVFFVGIGMILQLPSVLPLIKAKENIQFLNGEPNKKQFLMGSLFLTVLIGLVIPSTYIAASPQEYVDVTLFHHPLWYLVSSVSMAAGTFLVWMRVFYWLASREGKVLFDKLIWIACGVTVVNYMFFGTDLGVLSSNLQYENDVVFSRKEQLINLVVVLHVAIGLYYIVTKWNKLVTPVLLTAVIAFGAMSAMNVVKTKQSIDNINMEQNSDELSITLSKEGKNVVVLMLDRAIGGYLPYFLQEKPELKEQFAGFTYYSNTISFGAHTNFTTPALLGGYEYTPVEMNKRSEESLVSKHNEALKVMPVLFSQNGFDVTVSDPPYANYEWIPDLSIYDDYPEIKTYNSIGHFSSQEDKEEAIALNHRNFFCFSVMKSMPLCVQPTIYYRGTYNKVEQQYITQVIYDSTTAEGENKTFLESYNVLKNLCEITDITTGEKNTFLFMANEMTHEPMMLQEPNYEPVDKVDNTLYYKNLEERFNVNGRMLLMEDHNQVMHYEINMCALMQLGKWFDYLREQDVYDNTRIIVVSDHGQSLYQFTDLITGGEDEYYKDMEFYSPLLLMKDFESTELHISDAFMTNADVPILATQDVIDNPTNPFTGKELNDSEKTAHDQYVTMSADWDVEINDGNTFLPSMWACIRENLWDKNNWLFGDKEMVLDQHCFPE